MGSKLGENKFLWVIRNFISLQSEKIDSDLFTIGGCQWRLTAYPKGHNNTDNLSLFLAVANSGSLPSGWKRHTYVSFTLFDENTSGWGFGVTVPLALLHHKDSGFLVNEELKILVEVQVLVAIGGILNESEETTQPLKKIKQEKDDKCSYILNKTPQLEESFDVCGFLVRSTQVDAVKSLFESHPGLASQVNTKSHSLRTTYMYIILGLVETLCQSPQEISDNDLKEASVAVSYVANAGFKVDWLEGKLHQVLEKKNRVQYGEAGLLEMEEELLVLNEKCLDLEVLLEKEKAEVATAKIPLSFEDFL